MPYSLIGPDPITQLLATLNRPAAPDATAVANLPRFPAQRTIGARTVDAAPQMTGPLGALMSVGESMHNGIVARRQTGLKPEDYVQLALLAAPALGRLASLGKTATAAEPLATAIAGPEWAGAARAAAPEIAPVAARAIPGAEMQTLDAKSLTNLLSSGFANMPVSPESVVLPAGGAGRAGTTAAAVGRARRMVGEAKLRQLAKIEQAKRGGTSPESAMAAMEQVSRNVASGAVERPGLGVLADSAVAAIPKLTAKQRMEAAKADMLARREERVAALLRQVPGMWPKQN